MKLRSQPPEDDESEKSSAAFSTGVPTSAAGPNSNEPPLPIPPEPRAMFSSHMPDFNLPGVQRYVVEHIVKIK